MQSPILIACVVHALTNPSSCNHTQRTLFVLGMHSHAFNWLELPTSSINSLYMPHSPLFELPQSTHSYSPSLFSTLFLITPSYRQVDIPGPSIQHGYGYGGTDPTSASNATGGSYFKSPAAAPQGMTSGALINPGRGGSLFSS